MKEIGETTSVTPKQPVEFRVTDIPMALYQDICGHLGIGEESLFENSDSGNWWRKRKLDPTVTGCNVSVMVQKLHNHVYFKVYDFDLEAIKDRDERGYWASRPLLELTAGAQSAGVWAYGRGNLMKDSIYVNFRMSEISADNSALSVLGLILIRLNQICANPNCIKDSYWQAQRNPKADYTAP